ncbi:MAG: NUDIX domain-containing protein [Phycisphaerales bacterium]
MAEIPYRIAVLCYLYDERGRILLLHRIKPPNRDLFSPIGGKLEQAEGESPTECAQREIREEAGIEVAASDLHLCGVVSERSYEGSGHWLLFLYEVTQPVEVDAGATDEGRLEWHEPERVLDLDIPKSDREIIWPMFLKHRGGFFMLHIDCTDGEMRCTVEESRPATKAGQA